MNLYAHCTPWQIGPIDFSRIIRTIEINEMKLSSDFVKYSLNFRHGRPVSLDPHEAALGDGVEGVGLAEVPVGARIENALDAEVGLVPTLQNLFSVVTDGEAKYASVFSPWQVFQASLTFVTLPISTAPFLYALELPILE
jgi:hypothetical protein